VPTRRLQPPSSFPPRALRERYAVTPVYLAFVGKNRFAADGGLLYFSHIQPIGVTPALFAGHGFLADASGDARPPLSGDGWPRHSHREPRHP